MASSIFGERFGSDRVPAWQHLGEVFADPVTAVEAVKRAGITYQVTKEPLSWGDGNGIPDKFALVREPTPDDNTPRVFGFCGKAYEVLQHDRVAELVNGLTDEWPVATVGALGDGETVFMALDAGESLVATDKIHNYFLVTNSTTGGRAVRVAYVPVRVQSQTTLVTGLRAANLSSAISHVPGVAAEVQFRVNLLVQMRKAQQATLAVFQKMAETKVSDKQAQKVVEAAWPDPTTPAKVRLLQQIQGLENFDGDVAPLEKVASTDQYRRERLETFRQGAMELYKKFNETNPELAFTAWAIWNAVVETADYRNGASDESIAEATLFGPRAKEKVGSFAVAASFAK